MLTNIAVKNFKALRSADLPLGGITLFSGMNAVGKSSMIQVLLLLRQSLKDGSFQKGLFLKNEDYISLGLGKDIFSITSLPKETLDIELEWLYEHTAIWQFASAPNRDVLPLELFNPPKAYNWQESALFSNQFQYLSANRINPKVQYETSPYYVDELSSLGKEGEYTVHYLAKNKDRPIKNPILKHPDSKSDNLLDNVSAWLSDISAGIKVNATYHEELEVASLTYEFETAHGYTEGFKPTNVGFGLTYVLPVITALLSLPKGGLLIIENPESHLHPSGQSKVAQLCALAAVAGVQIIIESHSDHIFNGLRIAVRRNVLSHEDILTYYFHRQSNSSNHEIHSRTQKYRQKFFEI